MFSTKTLTEHTLYLGARIEHFPLNRSTVCLLEFSETCVSSLSQIRIWVRLKGTCSRHSFSFPVLGLLYILSSVSLFYCNSVLIESQQRRRMTCTWFWPKERWKTRERRRQLMVEKKVRKTTVIIRAFKTLSWPLLRHILRRNTALQLELSSRWAVFHICLNCWLMQEFFFPLQQ